MLFLGYLSSIFGGCREARPTRRPRAGFAWAADQLEPRLVLSSIVQTLDDGVVVTYDNTRISRIRYNGQDLLKSGGIYLIGSATGRDTRETNFQSIGSGDGRHMISPSGNIGPLFGLHFTTKGNSIHFVATVGPVNQDFAQMSLAFDFNKDVITTFAFGGTRLKFSGTGVDGWNDARPEQITRHGSRWRFDQIPQHQASYDAAGHLLGREGKALTRTEAEMNWVRLLGQGVAVKITIQKSENVKEMSITNHFVANSFGFGFATGSHPLSQKQTARIEGTITITPR